jgi:20S proteasome alpha/beta subunit
MTVCIAALCTGEDDGSRVVLATDRMVTQPGLMEYEHESKMVELTPRAAVMVAGNTLEGMRLVSEAAAAEMPDTIAALADELGRRYALARNARAGQVLGSHGLTWETFHQMHGLLNPQVVMTLERELEQYELGVNLLLAGVDGSGGHIHTNADPGGGNVRHDPMGWAAIGIGAPHVVPSMVGFGHSAGHGYRETLFRVYASKRRSEVAPGVGNETEMAVISADGTKRLSDALVEKLALIYGRFQKATERELSKRLASFDPEGDGG